MLPAVLLNSLRGAVKGDLDVFCANLRGSTRLLREVTATLFYEPVGLVRIGSPEDPAV